MRLTLTMNSGGQLIEANGLLIMWFIEWNEKAKDNPLQIQDFFKPKYNQSAGCDPWPMGGKSHSMVSMYRSTR